VLSAKDHVQCHHHQSTEPVTADCDESDKTIIVTAEIETLKEKEA
jgi:hypothetical protein